MARLLFAASAYTDTADILTNLAASSGRRAAAKFDARLERLLDRLADFPQSGAPRPAIGEHIRIGIVAPFVMVYRYDPEDDTVTVLRIVHGRRSISVRLLARS